MIFQVKVKVTEPRKVYTMYFSGVQEKYLYVLFLDTFKRDILTLHENFPSLICKIGPVMEQWSWKCIFLCYLQINNVQGVTFSYLSYTLGYKVSYCTEYI